MTRLRERFGALLLDLDGTLYRGNDVIPGAPQALSGATSPQALMYVTNNASRSAATVAGHLAELGFAATENEVVTSAQAAAHVLAGRLSPGATVLVVGTDDLAAEVERVGLRPIRRFDGAAPDAVVQGHSPQTAWPDLAEAAYALRAGALWVAANTDATLPNERGLAPGNGSMVAALRAATDLEPTVAGKPYAPLLEDALERAGTRDALVVGDRLDTDIDGALCVHLPSLLVLTGVSTLEDLRRRPADRLPTYVAESLDALNHPVAQTNPLPTDTKDIADRLAERLRQHPGRAVALTRWT
ncbi:HAD-IIA family hydrolase [Nocardia wallacei]|uniref:HAD-IIA family hydrolase n=1 Tax=Nocardia wallacei TaxID=480035 RepID=UPI00245758B8|nr:HAD-IIA family hydrolase [Nocardia wallacei]